MAASPPPERPAERIIFLDRLRLALILVIVLEHSTLAYSGVAAPDYFDPLRSSWYVVDAAAVSRSLQAVAAARIPVVIPLLFLISGLFLAMSAERRNTPAQAGRRLLRLGLPLVVIAMVLAPVMHAATWAATWRATPLSDLLGRLLFEQWLVGHGWFLWLLLAFSAAALSWRSAFPRSFRGLGGTLRRGLERHGPAVVPLAIFAMASVGYGASWGLAERAPAPVWRIVSGPFSFMEPLIVVDALFFVFGLALGQCLNAGRPCQVFHRPAIECSIGAATAAACLCLLVVLGEDWRLRDFHGAVAGSLILDVVIAPLYCAAASVVLLAAFARWANRPSHLWDSLSRAAFAIYVLHLPIVVWVQYALVPAPLSGISKAAITAGLAVAACVLAVQAWRAVRRRAAFLHPVAGGMDRRCRTLGPEVGGQGPLSSKGVEG